MTGTVLDVDVRGIAAGGDGIADLPDGRVVFVPRTTEGDRVRIRIERSRPRWARASLVKLLEPAATRVEAPCPKYGECGGCQLQHIAYADQLRWKRRFVMDALERIGHMTDVDLPAVVASPRELGYRNRISMTLRRLSGGYVVAGFHALGRPAHVLDIGDECLLPDTPVRELWSALRAGWGPSADRLPDAGRLRLTLRHADGCGELVVEGGRPGWDARALHDAVPTLSAVWHVPGRVDDDDTGAPAAELVAGGASHAGPAFTQVNEGAAALLRSHVLERCELPGEGAPPRTAVDAYCGTGAYGAALAETGWTVHGVEADPRAVARAREAHGAAEGEGRFDVREGRVEAVLADLLPVDLLVVNPPRSGLHEDVPGLILAAPPRRIVYVSCDPATLSRDVARLSEAYDVRGLLAFDLFPQTAHVETVAELSLRSTDE